LLKVSSFEIDEGAFVDVLQNCSDSYRIMNIKKLLIDTFDNGGGDVCNTGYLLKWINSSVSFRDQFSYDVKYSDLINAENIYSQETQFGGFNSSTYGNPATLQPYETFDYFNIGVNYTRGGVTAKYSQRFILYFCNETIDSLNFAPNDVLIITDGSCGSACNGFIRGSQELSIAKTIGFGGYLSTTNLESGSFAGGIAETLADELFYTYTLFGSNFTDVYGSVIPPAFLTSANLGWAIYEVYPYNNFAVPREFTSFKTNFKVNYYNYYEPDMIYSLATPYLYICPPPFCAVTTSPLTSISLTSSPLTPVSQASSYFINVQLLLLIAIIIVVL